MKKVLVGIILAMVMTALCGCGEKSPSDVVEDTLAAVKNKDMETVNNSYLGSDLDLDSAFTDSDISTDLSADSQALLEQKLLGFDYKVSNEKIDGNQATVDVTITTYDFGTAVQDFFRDAFSQALSLAFSGASDEEISQVMETSLNTVLNGLTQKNMTKTAKLTLTKTGEGWQIDDISKNTDFIDTFTGGGYSAAKNISDSFAGMNGTDAE